MSANLFSLNLNLKPYETLKPINTLFAAFIDWFLIALAIALSTHISPWFIPITWLVVASRQQALLVLMHEQVHFRLGRSRFWTELFSDAFLAWPILVSTQLYRKTHYLHHEELNDEKDPDRAFMLSHSEWHIPKSQRAFQWLLFKDITLLHWKENLVKGPFVTLWSPLARLHKSKDSPQGGLSTAYKIAVISFYIVVISVIFRLGFVQNLLLYWMLPMITLLPAFTRMRAMPEHLGLGKLAAPEAARTITGAAWLERFFIAPHGINFHREHHLNPRIPFYSLEQVHKQLIKAGVVSNVFETYWGSKGALNDLIEAQTSKGSENSAIVFERSAEPINEDAALSTS